MKFLITFLSSLAFVCQQVIYNSASPTHLEQRSPPITFAMESFLQYILRNDDTKCMLKLVCVVGANATRYGTYGDQMASYFGYFYNPYDFSVHEKPDVIAQFGRPEIKEVWTLASNVVSQDTSILDVNKTLEAELFNESGLGLEGAAVTTNLQGRTGFPAAVVFNQAFVMGLKSGAGHCNATFPKCPVDVDMLFRLGFNFFRGQNPVTSTV